MADLQFDEPQFEQSRAAEVRASWLSRLVMNTGLAKDEAGAQRVLLIVFVVVVLLTLGIWLFGPGTSASPPPPPPVIAP